MKLEFFSSCVEWPFPAEDLKKMVSEASDISRKTFLKYVNSDQIMEIEKELGYERDSRRGLTMAKDPNVSYHRSVLRGCPAVYFVWSATEFVFADLSCIK